MADAKGDASSSPLVDDPRLFNSQSGGRTERIVFNYRPLVLLIVGLLSVFLGWHALHLKLNVNYERMIPSSHPYILNFFEHRDDMRGLGDSLRIVVENTNGDIYDADYQQALREINDTVELIPGVDRPWVRSLWTRAVRWSEVSEVGYESGPVMPDGFDGSPASLDELRTNITRAGVMGNLVAQDLNSSSIFVPLLERYADTGEPIDYGRLSQKLEEDVRALETEHDVKVHIVGFAKLMGDLIEGLWQVLSYFALSAAIATAFVFLYTRCVRSTLLLVGVAGLGVAWLLGLMRILGYALDPFSVLVPFLVFAIGVSHGAQQINGIIQDISRGNHKYVAARYTFRRLFFVGIVALGTNVMAFAALMIIDIPAVQSLVLITSLGMFVLIFTKLLVIPIAVSYIGVSPVAVARAQRTRQGAVIRSLVSLTGRRRALVTIAIGGLALAVALFVRQDLQVGQLQAGASELRPDSRYNRDVAYVTANYGMTSDQFAVIIKTDEGQCDSYETLLQTGRLAWALEHVPGVQGTSSLYSQALRGLAGTNEGNPKWASLYNNRSAIGTAVQRIINDKPGSFNAECSVAPLVAYLNDQKADTLTNVLTEVEAFAAEHNTEELQFLPAAGSAGIAAITNVVVRDANRVMLFLVYGVTALLCFIAFRSGRAVVVALVPLIITSFMAEAIMVKLGIGISVSTLPVTALGVGVGVDYALYLLGAQLAHQRAGANLAESYRQALLSTGKIVALVGATMAAGVITWALSPIKFQADMGILLTFMFLGNMIGALVMIPALSHFLLNTGTLQDAPMRVKSRKQRKEDLQEQPA